MRAYIHVLSHPFFAVSGADGSYEIKGLPPGDYEIESIHEEYGAQTQKVTVAATAAAAAEFTYKAGQAYFPGSLETVPAMILHCCGK
jgi:hypothetical protein